jgi:hypothetical protein
MPMTRLLIKVHSHEHMIGIIAEHRGLSRRKKEKKQNQWVLGSPLTKSIIDNYPLNKAY